MNARLRDFAARLATGLRSPLGKVLAAALVLRLTGLTWGLPASDGWDDDGVAPRDFLVGVASTYWPAHHYTYPPLQLIILALVSAPVWIATLLSAPSLSPDAIVLTFIGVPTMTALAVVARATTAAMSLGVLWNVGKIGEDLGGSRRAGVWAAVACAANAVFTYYSQTTNLEVPYLLWSVLALRALVHAVTGEDVRALRRVPILAALAVATKDQAYALFLLGVPLTLAVWFLLDGRARRAAGPIVKELALGTAIGVAILLVLDGALFNPRGFADRVAMLLGSASQDHAYYARTLLGRIHALRDCLRIFPEFYTWAFVPWVLIGLGVVARASSGARRAAGLAPLLFAISFTLAFNLTAGRSEHRFVLPQMMMSGIYAGLGFDAFTRRAAGAQGARARLAWVRWAVVTASFACAFFRCTAVDAAMVFDPRYDTETWLREHVLPGDHVEVYGNNVHLPRFAGLADVARVEPSPIAGRNPLPGVVEVSDRFSNVRSRRPRFIVVSEFWAWRYLMDPEVSEAQGRVLTPEQSSLQADVDSRAYFRALRDGRLGYRRAHTSEWQSSVWPRIDIHASLTRAMWIFEREP